MATGRDRRPLQSHHLSWLDAAEAASFLPPAPRFCYGQEAEWRATRRRWRALRIYHTMALLEMVAGAALVLAGIVTCCLVQNGPRLDTDTGPPLLTGILGLVTGVLVYMDWRRQVKRRRGRTRPTSLMLIHLVFGGICLATCAFFAIWNVVDVCTSDLNIVGNCHGDSIATFIVAIVDFVIEVMLFIICLIPVTMLCCYPREFGYAIADTRLPEDRITCACVPRRTQGDDRYVQSKGQEEVTEVVSRPPYRKRPRPLSAPPQKNHPPPVEPTLKAPPPPSPVNISPPANGPPKFYPPPYPPYRPKYFSNPDVLVTAGRQTWI